MHALSTSVESTFGSRARLMVTGNIVAETNDALLAAVEDLIHQGFEDIRLDLSGVEYISSSGISVFLELQALGTQHGVRIELDCFTPKVQELLRLAGVVHLSEMFAPHE